MGTEEESHWKPFRVTTTKGKVVTVKMTTVPNAQRRGLRREPHPAWKGKEVGRFGFAVKEVTVEALWEAYQVVAAEEEKLNESVVLPEPEDVAIPGLNEDDADMETSRLGPEVPVTP